MFWPSDCEDRMRLSQKGNFRKKNFDMGGQNGEKFNFAKKVPGFLSFGGENVHTYMALCAHVRHVRRYTTIHYGPLGKCIQGPSDQGGVGKKLPKFDFELKLRRNGRT